MAEGLTALLDTITDRSDNLDDYANATIDFIQDIMGQINLSAMLEAAANGTIPLMPEGVSVNDIFDTIPDINVTPVNIGAPPRPDWTMLMDSAPTKPILEDIEIGLISGIPSFDVPTVSLSFPAQPTMASVADIGDPDPIANIEYAARPSYTLPVIPTLHEATLPGPPSMTMPEFEGSMPIDDLIIPTNTFQFGENIYSSGLLDAAKAKLENDVKNGGTGLGAAIEDAIWRRQQERDEQAIQEARDKAASDWAVSGFSLPDGVLSTMLQDLEKQYLDTRLTTSRDISVKQAELALDNQKFSIQQAVVLESTMIGYASQRAQRALDAAKATIDASVAIFNAAVAKYNAKIQGYQVQATVYESRIRAALAQAEIYKTQIEAAKLTVDMDLAYVELYKAQLAGVQSLIDCYKADMEAARIKTDCERLKIEAFKSRVDAYTAKINMNVALFNMYDAAIRGEAVKSDIYRTQVEAYKVRVDAVGIEAGIATDRAKIESEMQKNTIEMYNSEVQAFRSKVEAEKARIDAIVNIYGADIEAYKAAMSAETSLLEMVIKKYSADIERANAVADCAVKAAGVAMEMTVAGINATAETSRAGLAAAAQVTAAGLASRTFSVHAGDSTSHGWTVSDSTSNATSNSTSEGHMSSNSVSASINNSTSENHNYNY